jgi:hypothetical protein
LDARFTLNVRKHGSGVPSENSIHLARGCQCNCFKPQQRLCLGFAALPCVRSCAGFRPPGRMI